MPHAGGNLRTEMREAPSQALLSILECSLELYHALPGIIPVENGFIITPPYIGNFRYDREARNQFVSDIRSCGESVRGVVRKLGIDDGLVS